MTSNYWTSTQYLHWETKHLAGEGNSSEVKDDLIDQLPLPEKRHLYQYFQHRERPGTAFRAALIFDTELVKLGRRLNTRQIALATAQVFLLRFYSRVRIRRTNPYRVIATAFYLACKVEECPHHIRIVVAEARTLWPDFIQADTSRLGECEFHIISELNAQLVVHNPYRTLIELQARLSLSTDEVALAWSVTNDHYLTDLALHYPPHMIAAAAVVLALTTRSSHTALPASSSSPRAVPTQRQSRVSPAQAVQTKGQMLIGWLADTTSDVEVMIDCTQELISLYVVLEGYSEKMCRDQISRAIKARGLDK